MVEKNISFNIKSVKTILTVITLLITIISAIFCTMEYFANLNSQMLKLKDGQLAIMNELKGVSSYQQTLRVELKAVAENKTNTKDFWRQVNRLDALTGECLHKTAFWQEINLLKKEKCI